MNSNMNNALHYDAYYEWEENNKGNYEHDDGEYVLELNINGKEPNSHENKPRHKRSEPGVYDELDYNLSPRNETHSQNQILVDDWEKRDGCSKHKKMAIISILVITLVASVVTGAALATYGKYDLPFQLPNSSMDFMPTPVNPSSVIYSLLLLGLQNDITSDADFHLKTTTTPPG